MANELQITIRATWDLLTAVVGSLPVGFAEALGRDVAGTKILNYVQVIQVSPAEALFAGDVGFGGYAIFRNNDDTNYVSLRPAADVPDAVRLLPGDVAIFRTAPSTHYAIADTAPVELEYWLLEA